MGGGGISLFADCNQGTTEQYNPNMYHPGTFWQHHIHTLRVSGLICKIIYPILKRNK